MLSPGWYVGALCSQTDPELFYPPMGSNGAPAKRVCDMCPMKAQCREVAMENQEEFGVWGGTTPTDRLLLLREVHGEDFQWPVAGGVAQREQRECRQGHDLTDDSNILVSSTTGHRRCRMCRQLSRPVYDSRKAS